MKIRSPIVSVLGHVDHGKTTLLDYIRGSTIADREAGGITQHIGATEIPNDTIEEICGNFISRLTIKDLIPGLFFIDTPGHAAFTSLRKRGGALADLAVLILDINEGFKPQTYEALNILKMYKTPFIVVANKIDMIFGWEPHEGVSFKESFNQQAPSVQQEVDLKVYEIVGTLHKEGFQSERFDRVSNFASQITIIPISARTGEGIIEVLAMLLGLAQEYLTSQLEINEDAPAKGTVLEIKEETGLGLTIDSIIYDGVLRTNDEIALMTSSNEVLTTKIRSILRPLPLEEMRDSKKKFQKFDEVVAAAGIKIADPTTVTVTLNNPREVKAAETLQVLYASGALSSENNWSESSGLFIEGKSIMVSGVWWFVKADNRWFTDLWGEDTRYGYVPFPRPDDMEKDKQRVAEYGTSLLAFASARDSAHPAGVTYEDVYMAMTDLYLRTNKYYSSDPSYDPEAIKRAGIENKIDDPESVEAAMYWNNSNVFYDAVHDFFDSVSGCTLASTAGIYSVVFRGTDYQSFVDSMDNTYVQTFTTIYSAG